MWKSKILKISLRGLQAVPRAYVTNLSKPEEYIGLLGFAWFLRIITFKVETANIACNHTRTA
jgi:hypothetical protein